MALDPERSLSRRALVAGTLGAVVAAVASGLGRSLPVEADSDKVRYTNDENDQSVIIAQSLEKDGHSGSGTGVAVFGYSTRGSGVQGGSLDGFGVRGRSTAGVGVVGTSLHGTGIRGGSNSYPGVRGDSKSGEGVYGVSQSYHGVGGYSTTGPGVDGQSDTGYGVTGSSDNGRGAKFFSGKQAQVNLAPGGPTHPEEGMKGDLFVDRNGHLWFCKGTTHWVKLA